MGWLAAAVAVCVVFLFCYGSDLLRTVWASGVTLPSHPVDWGGLLQYLCSPGCAQCESEV
eukprot:9226296-Prorocentrum_lima.AAC.1